MARREVNIRLDEDLYLALRDEAHEEFTSMNALIVEALKTNAGIDTRYLARQRARRKAQERTAGK